jgi:hypothetical protein
VTALDRLLVWLARQTLRLVGRRFNQAKDRVWHMNVATLRPQRLPSGALTPKAGLVFLGFGAERNLFAMHVTREMLELFRDSTIDVIEKQDAQYAIVEDERR